MPKKFVGENSKAVESRARRAAKKEDDDIKKQQVIEDEYWKDDDKHMAKKMQRKDDKEKKKCEQLQRKKELQQIADEEMNSLAKSSAKNAASKVTRAQADLHKKTIDDENKKSKDGEEAIEENLNKMAIEGSVAQDVEEAINILSADGPELDMHPEKRMKAAYLAFEERSLPLLKAENPSMRLSQLKQMLRKEWTKSPENPINQALKLNLQSVN